MADTLIPEQVIKGYKTLKKDYPNILKKFASATDSKTTDAIIDEIKDLFKTFDQGLSGLMKSAKTTDDPDKAKATLEKILKVTDDYEKKTDKIHKWALKTVPKNVDRGSGEDLSASDVNSAFKMISSALERISGEANKGLKGLK